MNASHTSVVFSVFQKVITKIIFTAIIIAAGTISTINTMDQSIDLWQPKENFEQLVARLGIFAIPEEVLVKNIFPRVVSDLIASKHNVDVENISRFLHYIKSLQDFKIWLLNQGWKVVENIMAPDWQCTQDNLKKLVEQPIAQLKDWLSTNTALENDVIEKSLGQDMQIILETVCLANTLSDGQLFQIFNDSLEQLRVLWAHMKDSVKNKFVDPCMQHYSRDFGIDNKGVVEHVLKELLSQPDENIRFKDLGQVIGKIPLACLFSFENMKKKEWISECEWITTLYCGLSRDQLKQIDLILENTQKQMKQLVSQLKPEAQVLMKDQVENKVELLLGKIRKDIELLKTPVRGVVANQHTIAPQFQDPTIQMLFFAANNNVALMQWLAAYNSKHINQKEPVTNKCPLDIALENGNLEALQLMVSHGVVLNNAINDPIDYHKNRLLHKVCEQGDINFVSFLFKHGANPNVVNHEGKTPLMSILARNVIDFEVAHTIVQLLLNNGADVNVSDSLNITPLIYACKTTCEGKQSYITIVRLLIDNSAVIDAQDCEGFTALLYACKYNALDLVKLLIANGANVNAQDPTHLTPLHRACGYLQPEIVEVLLKNYAKIDAQTIRGYTAYDLIGHEMYHRSGAENRRAEEQITTLLRFYGKPEKKPMAKQKTEQCVIS